jgi:hypothetical protein
MAGIRVAKRTETNEVKDEKPKNEESQQRLGAKGAPA